MVVAILILLNIVLSTTGQLLLKYGVNKVVLIANPPSFLFFYKCFLSPFVLLGLFFYAVTTLVWFVLLSKAELSIVYPTISLVFITVLFSSYFFLGEPLTFSKFLGVGLICFGTFILFR